MCAIVVAAAGGVVATPSIPARSAEVRSPEPIWTADTGSFASPPVVADGVVYVSTAKGPLFAFDERCAEAGATCDPLWTGKTGGAAIARYPAPIARSLLRYPVWFDDPVVDDGMVYVVGPGATRVLAFPTGCASRGDTCAPAWTTGVDAHTSMPAVAGGMVYVTAGGRLFAYRSSCGTSGGACDPAWAVSGDSSGFLWEIPPVVGDGLVFAKSFGGGLFAFDAASGKLRWRAQAGLVTGGRPSAPAVGSLGSPPLLDGRMVFVTWAAAFDGDGSRVFAFDAGCRTDGGACRPAWTADLPDSVLTIFGPSAWDGALYVGTETAPASGEGHVYVFEERCERSCSPSAVTDLPGELVVTGPSVVADGSVAIASAEEGFVGIVPARCGSSTCSPKWLSFSNIAPLRGVIEGRNVFFGSSLGTLYAFETSCPGDPTGCRPVWEFSPRGQIVSSPVVDHGTVFATTNKGEVYALPEVLSAGGRAKARTGGNGVGWVAWPGLAALVLAVVALAGLRRRRSDGTAPLVARERGDRPAEPRITKGS